MSKIRIPTKSEVEFLDEITNFICDNAEKRKFDAVQLVQFSILAAIGLAASNDVNARVVRQLVDDAMKLALRYKQIS